MAGPADDDSAGFAAFLHANVVTAKDENPVYEALAEARGAKPADFTSAPRAAFYVASGTHKVYARSGWDDKAFWAAFTSGPKIDVDHQHLDASNFVFSRGADAILADPSPYGSLSTLTGNAISVDSRTVQNDYRPSQSPYSRASLPWSRGTEGGVVAARADVASAFADDSGSSDVPFARRDWVFLPEGEIVTIDRVRTDAPTRKSYLRFRSPGAFALDGKTATAQVGGSKLVLHAVTLSGGAPATRRLTGNANDPCDGVAFGVCDAARFDAGEYSVALPGPSALAVHVLDGIGADETPAEALEIGDPAVVGASVTRGSARTFVVASSAKDGVAGASLAYKASGDRPARHVVFDAPEDASGKSHIVAKGDGGNCAITITAGGGDGAFDGRPLVFQLGAAPGCAITEDKGALPDAPPSPGAPSGGGAGTSPEGAENPSSHGCACRAQPSETDSGGFLAIAGLVYVTVRSRRRAK
jgi:MYXO-CTERM domain-containing protein